jgi:Cytochrome c oxidase subunit VII
MLTSRAARLVQAPRIRSFHSSPSNDMKGYVLRTSPVYYKPANTPILVVSTDSYTDSSIARIECLIINACTKRTMGKGSGGRWVELLRMCHADFWLTRGPSQSPRSAYILYPYYCLVFFAVVPPLWATCRMVMVRASQRPNGHSVLTNTNNQGHRTWY